MSMDIERQNFLPECKENFDKFKQELDEVLMKRHGITANDCTDEDQIRVEHLTGSTVVDFVEHLATKYDLDRIDLFPFN